MPGILGLDSVTVHGQTDRPLEREPIFALSIRGRKAADAVEEFARSGISLNTRVRDAYSGHTLEALGVDECIRVSACHYNTVPEVQQFLKILARLPSP